MAKKVRATSSTYRPGGLGPARTGRTAGTSAAPPGDAPWVTSDMDIDAAVDAVSQQTGELTISASTPATSAARRSRRGAKARPDSLQAQAAAEDAYIREDLRRIAKITGSLVIGLLIAWVLFVPMNLLGLY